MTGPPPAPGWYPDPDDAGRLGYWDGATWSCQPPSISDSASATAADKHPADPNRRTSGLTIIRGVCLILLALLFGFVAAVLLRAGAMDSNTDAAQVVEAIWRTYFGTMLTLCAIALILGVLALGRPAVRPLYSVITGVSVIVVGLAGSGLGFLSVSSLDSEGVFIGYETAGLLFAFGGAIATLLSAIDLAAQRRSASRPASACPQPPGGFQPAGRPGTLGWRLLARLIDGVLVGVVVVPLILLTHNVSAAIVWLPGLFAGLLTFVYFVGFEVHKGWTPGKKLLGMHVRGAAGAAKPTVRQSAIRNAFTLLAVIPLIGQWLALIAGLVIAVTIYSSTTKQGQHDSFAGGTQVVKNGLRRVSDETNQAKSV